MKELIMSNDFNKRTIYSIEMLLFDTTVAAIATAIQDPNSNLRTRDEFGRWVLADADQKILVLDELANRQARIDDPGPDDELFYEYLVSVWNLLDHYAWLVNELPAFNNSSAKKKFADALQVNIETGQKENRQKKNANQLRTEHFMNWLKETGYDGCKTNYSLDDELRQDKPELWGKNMETFNKWLQSSEAKDAKEQLEDLKLKARQQQR